MQIAYKNPANMGFYGINTPWTFVVLHNYLPIEMEITQRKTTYIFCAVVVVTIILLIILTTPTNQLYSIQMKPIIKKLKTQFH